MSLSNTPLIMLGNGTGYFHVFTYISTGRANVGENSEEYTKSALNFMRDDIESGSDAVFYDCLIRFLYIVHRISFIQ